MKKVMLLFTMLLLVVSILTGFDIQQLTKEANEGNAVSQFTLGLYYSTQEDVENCVFWYEKAIENNNDSAMYNLGYLYYMGSLVEKDEQKGLELLRKSAELKNSLAIFFLQNMHLIDE